MAAIAPQSFVPPDYVSPRTLPDNVIKYINVKSVKFDLSNNKAEIITYSVSERHSNKYLTVPDLLSIRRGHSELYIDSKLTAVLLGPKKFDGTTDVDDDDIDVDQGDTSAVSMINMAEIRRAETDGHLRVYFKEKANGKFFIARIITINDKPYIFGGSKNMHRLYRINWDKPGVDYFGSEYNPDDLHHQMIMYFASQLNTGNKRMFVDTRYTVLGEFVDGKHLVYTETPYMVYFGDYAAQLGLPVVRDILPHTNKLPTINMLRTIRSMQGIEGVVIEYRIDAPDRKVLHRQKHKTTWYIMWRAIRQVIATKNIENRATYDSVCEKLERVVKLRGTRYLNLDAENIARWGQTARRFLSYLLVNNTDLAEISHDGDVGVGYHIKKFENLSEQQLTDILQIFEQSWKVHNVAERLMDEQKFLFDLLEKDPKIDRIVSRFNYAKIILRILSDVNMEGGGVATPFDPHVPRKGEDEGVTPFDPRKVGDEEKVHATPASKVDTLVCRTIYETALALARSGLELVIIMSGVPGCGKSTTAELLTKDLAKMQIRAETFSADKYFMRDGRYVYVREQLGKNHERCFADYEKSKARVRIVDNTNLSRVEYNKYLNSPSAKHCVPLVFTHHVPMVNNTLVNRSVHRIPNDVIIKMAFKYHPYVMPGYVGLFVSKPNLIRAVAEAGFADLRITQIKPLHATCKYYGSKGADPDAEAKENDPYSDKYGTVYELEIVGLHTNIAGTCVVVRCPAFPNADHITIVTNDGYSPTAVGEQFRVRSLMAGSVDVRKNAKIQAVLSGYY